VVTFFTVVHIISALFMILVILVQGGNSGGMGAAFGGGSNTGGVLGTGANTFFSKLTYGAAVIFMATSVYLTWDSSQSGKTGLTEKLQQKAAETSGATPEVKETEEDTPADK